MKVPLALIVEGHGEDEAVPLLLRRILREIDPAVQLELRASFRVPATKLLKEAELERHVDLIARRAGAGCPLLILLDCDDDCPARLGPVLLDRARRARSDLSVAVVLAEREFETWFLAAARSLRGVRSLAADLEAPANPVAVRGAKEWLSNHMPVGHSYRETVDQAALAARFDFATARAVPSFARLERLVRAWLVPG